MTETAAATRDWTAYACECGHAGCTSYRIRGLYQSDGAYSEADARLIAASPSLLAAAVAVIGEGGPAAGEAGHIDFHEAITMLRAAIEAAS